MRSGRNSALDVNPPCSPRDRSGAETPRRYRGRFAPSPTGDLHFGSLVAALASYLDARAAGGDWLVRIENLDPPREVPGSADRILHTLETFGFEWDDAVRYQSDQFARYREISAALVAQGQAYPCRCTRKQIAAVARQGIEGHVYPGTCRTATLPDRGDTSLRLRTDDNPIAFTDGIQGALSQRLESTFGDFVIRRTDGLFAYQLAVVVDDWEQGITDVVRGCDLLHSTTRQIALQHCLNATTPRYAHIPLALDSQGRKLSKSDGDHPITRTAALQALRTAWTFLQGASAPAEVQRIDEFWALALPSWEIHG